MRIWAITQTGRKISGDISQKRTPEMEVLLAVRSLGSASTEDISSYCGIPKGRVGIILRKLARNGMVQELTNG